MAASAPFSWDEVAVRRGGGDGDGVSDREAELTLLCLYISKGVWAECARVGRKRMQQAMGG